MPSACRSDTAPAVRASASALYGIDHFSISFQLVIVSETRRKRYRKPKGMYFDIRAVHHENRGSRQLFSTAPADAARTWPLLRCRYRAYSGVPGTSWFLFLGNMSRRFRKQKMESETVNNLVINVDLKPFPAQEFRIRITWCTH